MKNGFILAAGKGTRMGEAGARLPKLMWPLFEHSALELQILYLYDWGCQKIYINLFSQADEIIEHIATSPVVKRLSSQGLEIIPYREPKLLGTAGSFRFLKQKFSLSGPLLANNGDQFFLCSDTEKLKFKKAFVGKPLLLLTTTVPHSHQYGGIETDEKGYITKLVPHKEVTTSEHLTFSGLRILDMDHISEGDQFCHFFESLYPLDLPILTCKIAGNYFDLGTLNRYQSLLADLYKDFESDFFRWLLQKKAIELAKVDREKKSYNASKNLCFNFSGDKVDERSNTVFLRKNLSIDINF